MKSEYSLSTWVAVLASAIAMVVFLALYGAYSVDAQGNAQVLDPLAHFILANSHSLLLSLGMSVGFAHCHIVIVLLPTVVVGLVSYLVLLWAVAKLAILFAGWEAGRAEKALAAKQEPTVEQEMLWLVAKWRR